MTRDNSCMEITQAQFEPIAHCLPTQRGNVSLSNLTVLNAVLYVAEHCPRRPNFDHPCRLNIDQGWKAARSAAVCG